GGGAWLARPLPLPGPLGLAAPAALVTVALGARRPLLLVVAVGLLTSVLAARSWAGLHPPSVGRWQGTATLVSDPVDGPGGLHADVRVRGKRLEAWAHGWAAARLRPRLAGERVTLDGRLERVPGRQRDRLARRHVGGRLSVATVGGWRPGDAVSRLANGVR